MVKTAIAFLFGCLLTLNLPVLPEPDLFWSGLLLLLLAVSVFRRNWFVLFFILGALWSAFHAYQTLNDRFASEKQNQVMLIQGRIASLPEHQTDKIRFLFAPDSDQLPQHIALSWYTPSPPFPKAGEKWQLQVKLKQPHGLSNPDGFDYEAWLFQQRIGATGYVKNNTNNQKLSSAAWYDTQHWRQQLADKLSIVLADSPSRPLILGLTVGVRNELDQNNWQVLQKTGTSHLLAISGLHIGLAAFIVFFLWRWLWALSPRALLWLPAQQSAAIAALFGDLGYALMAGMTIPTQRALIMTATALIGMVSLRSFYLNHFLAASLFLILLHDPFAVLSAGFWLSFTAVFFILLTSSNRHPKVKGHWFNIHLWLCIGLMPFVVLFFQQTSLIAPVANLLAVPFISFVIIPVLFMAVVLISLWPTASQALFSLADYGLEWLWKFLEWLAALPLASWHSSHLPIFSIGLAMFGAVLLLLPKGIPARWLGIFAILPSLLFKPGRPETDQMIVTVLDVGQGLSVVVETHQHVLVFDTGSYFSSRFDMGSAVLVPFLQSRGIEKVDTLIISHSDIDHAGGTRSLRKLIPIQQTFSSDTVAIHHSQPCIQGQQWQWDGIRFEILQPFPHQTGSDNNLSCVIKVSSPAFSVLLTGDIEQPSEQLLVENYGDSLHADILVVPHHGSRSSSSPAFIDAVHPRIASFSAGYLNRYHFPAEDIMERYQNSHIRILRTDQSGAQIFSTDNEGQLNIVRWREHNQHLWISRPTD